MKDEIKIESNQKYTLYEIVKYALIPGIDTMPKAARLIHTDLKKKKILNAVRMTRGEFGIQYKVLGSNITKYLKTLSA